MISKREVLEISSMMCNHAYIFQESNKTTSRCNSYTGILSECSDLKLW